MDTTFLPGTLVFELFGHEIQLLPRVLTIDKKEQPWRSNETIALPNTHGARLRPVGIDSQFEQGADGAAPSNDDLICKRD
jgi:hypothetical protein